MIRRIVLPRRARVLAPALSLSVAMLAAAGCGTEDIKLAEVPADVTVKVEKGQARPVAKADKLPPDKLPPGNQQSKGRPY